MAGLIRREDIDEVRERTDIKEVVDGYVTLKGAGLGSFKGLCPFHDERSPSFHVRPQVGLYHCFGCGEGGDVISFVKKVDHISFSEAVEQLAAPDRLRAALRGRRHRAATGRTRPAAAAARGAQGRRRSSTATSCSPPAAAEGRKFLAERGFDQAAAEQFGVGYAPQGWDRLLRHLRGRGFTDTELSSPACSRRAAGGSTTASAAG